MARLENHPKNIHHVKRIHPLCCRIVTSLKVCFHPAFLALVISWLAFVRRHFRGPRKWRQQRQTKRRHVQGMLDERDPLRLRFHYSVFKCLRFHIAPFSDDLEPFPLLRFRQERLVRKRGCFHYSVFVRFHFLCSHSF